MKPVRLMLHHKLMCTCEWESVIAPIYIWWWKSINCPLNAWQRAEGRKGKEFTSGIKIESHSYWCFTLVFNWDLLPYLDRILKTSICIWKSMRPLCSMEQIEVTSSYICEIREIWSLLSIHRHVWCEKCTNIKGLCASDEIYIHQQVTTS